MLFISEQSTIYRYFAIDPGSNTLGFSIFDLNMVTKRLSIIETATIHGEKLSRDNIDTIDIHGNKTARLIAHQQLLLQLLLKWNPQGIVCESAYMGRFPQAYAVLVETLSYLRQAVFQYDPYMHVELVDPSTAKKNINAAIKGKDGVRDVILKMIPAYMDYYGTTPLELLDEHSIDSINIGYYKYTEMMKYLRC